MVRDVFLQFARQFRRSPEAVLQRDEGGDGLTLDFMGATDDGGLGDGGMRDQRGLHLHRRNVMPRDQHDVVHAAQQPEVAVLVAPRPVAREVQILAPNFDQYVFW